MSYFFQIVVSGIVVGSIYALAALGLVLVYKSSRVANFAHGQIIAAGAFITYFLTVTLAIPIFFSFLASMIITFFLAMSVERIFLRRLIGEPIISVIMVTIGLGSILDGLINVRHYLILHVTGTNISVTCFGISSYSCWQAYF